jgi:Flp pilus assembly protein TadD
MPELWLRLGDALKAAGKSLEAEFAYRKSMALRGAPGQS